MVVPFAFNSHSLPRAFFTCIRRPILSARPQVSEGLADLFPRLLADLLVPAAAGAKGGDDEKQAESHMSDKSVWGQLGRRLLLFMNRVYQWPYSISIFPS